MTLSSLSALCWAALTLPQLQAPASAPQTASAAMAIPAAAAAGLELDADVARLIPAQANWIVRCSSLSEALTIFGELKALGEPYEAPPSVAEYVRDTLELPGDATLLATDRPVFVSAVIGMGGAQPIVALPVSDADAFAKSVADQPVEYGAPWKALASGRYVGISQSPGFALSDSACALAANLPAGSLAMRMDLGNIVDTFRDLIEMGLDQVESSMDQLSESPEMQAQMMGMDPSAMLGVYIDGLRDFMDSAEILDVAVERHDGRYDFLGAIECGESSPMGRFAGDAKPVDLWQYPGVLDTSASIAFVGGGDWKIMLDRTQGFMNGLAGVYPPGMRDLMQGYFDSLKELYVNLGPVVAGSGDIGADGMRVAYFTSSPDAAGTVQKLAQALDTLGGKQSGIQMTPFEKVQGEGGTTLRGRFKFTEGYFDSLMSNPSLDEEARKEASAHMRQMMESLFGKDGMNVTLDGRANLVSIVLGEQEYAARALRAAAGPKERPSAAFARAMDSLKGAQFAMVYGLDFGRMLAQMRDLPGLLPAPQMAELGALPDQPLPILTWFGIRGRHWSGGMGMEYAALQRFVRALKAAEEAHQDGAQEEAEEGEEGGERDH